MIIIKHALQKNKLNGEIKCRMNTRIKDFYARKEPIFVTSSSNLSRQIDLFRSLER